VAAEGTATMRLLKAIASAARAGAVAFAAHNSYLRQKKYQLRIQIAHFHCWTSPDFVLA